MEHNNLLAIHTAGDIIVAPTDSIGHFLYFATVPFLFIYLPGLNASVSQSLICLGGTFAQMAVSSAGNA
jgi:hypothetical protein